MAQTEIYKFPTRDQTKPQVTDNWWQNQYNPAKPSGLGGGGGIPSFFGLPSGTSSSDLKWIREYFAPGQISYDLATRTITLPGGMQIPQDMLVTRDGKTYISPAQLAQWYSTYAATYQPPEPTAEDIRREADKYMAIYNPRLEAIKSRLGLEQQKIVDTAEAQRKLAEAAWANAAVNLGEQENQELRATAHTVAGRGLSSSPLAEYQRRKVQEAFGKERAKLETESAAQLANIATQASLAAYDLAQKGKEVEADWASQIAEYAYNSLQGNAAQQKAGITALANYLDSAAKRLDDMFLAQWELAENIRAAKAQEEYQRAALAESRRASQAALAESRAARLFEQQQAEEEARRQQELETGYNRLLAKLADPNVEWTDADTLEAMRYGMSDEYISYMLQERKLAERRQLLDQAYKNSGIVLRSGVTDDINTALYLGYLQAASKGNPLIMKQLDAQMRKSSGTVELPTGEISTGGVEVTMPLKIKEKHVNKYIDQQLASPLGAPGSSPSVTSPPWLKPIW